jgi:hypothetical protein
MNAAILLFAALCAADAPTLQATVGRDGSRVEFTSEDGTTIVDVVSKFGIDKATVRRLKDDWPEAVVARLHLSGLESFRVGNGDVALEWSVSSTGSHAPRVTQWKGQQGLAISKDSPYHTTVRMVGGNGKIPLKGGFFEVPLPAKLFERNPEQITLRWIDFYR